MIFRRGDMFADFPSHTVWLVTTNSFVKRSGELVMGRGAAAQAARLWPTLPATAGRYTDHLKAYGVRILAGIGQDRHVGLFQVKYHFMDMADLGLIEESCMQLAQLATSMSDYTFRVNYPGIAMED